VIADDSVLLREGITRLLAEGGIEVVAGVADVAEFLEVVGRVAAGGSAIDPEVVRQILARTHRSDPLARLSPRETEVLALMAEGHSNRSIAGRLFVSCGAVEKHVSNIFMKLDLPPDDECHQRRVMAVVRYLNS
jgi:DNA-binding NarL/FixJ family response regulator